MPFNNPVVGGTALVRTAINSPNFVAGLTGWSINRDGSAEFNSATIRGELDIGVSPNPRIAITGNIPSVLATWGATNSVTISEVMILYWNATDFKWWATGTFVGQNCTFVGTYDTTNGVYVLERTLDTGAGAIETRFGSYSLNSFQELWTTQQLKLRIGDGSNINDAFVCNGTAVSNTIYYNSNGLGTAESWQAVSGGVGYSAPWADFGAPAQTVRFRRMPDGTVSLSGEAKTTANITAPSPIFTLPAGYRPAADEGFPANIAGGRIAIQSSGTVVLVDAPTVATTITILTLSHVRFPLSSL